MRKTPLSAPGGSYGRKNNYDWNSRGRRGLGFDDNNTDSGYGQFQSDNKHGGSFIPGQNQPSPQKPGDDFIPLGYSSPVGNQRPVYNNYTNNWRGHGNGPRNRGTPPSPGQGFNNSYRRNFYHDTPKSSFNQSNSPRFHQKHHYGPRRPHQKDAHRQVNISSYLNVKSILEDPWADLVRNLEKRNSENGNRVEKSDSNLIVEDPIVKLEKTDISRSDCQESAVISDEKLETASVTTETTQTTTTTTITNTPS